MIGRNTAKPPEADGIYVAGSGKPEPWRMGAQYDIYLMIFGDSTTAGLAASSPTKFLECGLRVVLPKKLENESA